MEHSDTRKIKILFLFTIVFFGFIIFLGTLFYWAQIDRRLPTLSYEENDFASRGSIISSDGFKIATSKKLYKASVDTRNIDPDKRTLFLKLYSLYSGDPIEQIDKILKSNNGIVVLSYKIDAKKAKYIQSLAKKLIRLGVFRSYEDPKTKVTFTHGLSVGESGENRLYPAKTSMTPLVGYIKKIEQDSITKVMGVKGIERYYEDKLLAIQDSFTQGQRDLSNAIILNGKSVSLDKIDGYDIHLSISLKLQKLLENLLDERKKEFDAKEIVVAVMHAKSGAILSLASSNRYDPNFIKREDYNALNPSSIEDVFEPGSVMKSIIFSLLLRENKVNPYDIVRVYGGKFKLGKQVITDTHDYEWLSAEDVIVHSSNIGMAQLAQNLDAIEFYQGLKDFGFSQKTNIDLPYEAKGMIPPIQKLKSQTYKATVSYGYGLSTTFMQILKAYNVFNNNGRMVTPSLVSHIALQNGKKYEMPSSNEKEILPISVAKRMQKILIKTVKKGTGTRAAYEGLQIGGKTGTAHIASDGGYANNYNSSFVGFANDDKNKFTIGVLVREPKKRYYHFASLNAVPIFREVVAKLVDEGYLQPNLTSEQ
ncbi:MAG: penicillin-binding protein 2 [Sulfurospirillum sp.]|nr:penicillin-binding protein 2 [Sulfurospirillum sp.]